MRYFTVCLEEEDLVRFDLLTQTLGEAPHVVFHRLVANGCEALIVGGQLDELDYWTQVGAAQSVKDVA